MPQSSINVLVIADSTPDKAIWTELIAALDAEGAQVVLASYLDLPVDYPQPASAHALMPAGEGHGPAFRRAVKAAKAAHRLSIYAEYDHWLRERARSASIVFALDKNALPAARKLAGDHAVVATSLDEALAQIRAAAPKAARVRIAAPSIAQRARGLAVALPARLIGFLLQLPGVGDPVRYRFARDAALHSLRQARPEHADRLVRVALRKIVAPRLRADLLGDLVSAVLAAGGQPALAKQAYAAELAIADKHLGMGSFEAAANSLAEAARTAFHRALHLDGVHSPLAQDPAGFTAPWHESRAASALIAPRGRATAPVQPPAGRPVRLLIGTWANANFLAEIRDCFGHHPDVELRFVDLSADAELGTVAHSIPVIARRVLAGEPASAALLEERLRPHLDWADVVFVEWCTMVAVLATLVDPRDTRLIVRLHSYEVFTHWPQLVDFTRVDDMVFVSEHLRDLATAAIPAIAGVGGPRTHVLPNAIGLRELVREKPDEARFTLALLGWSSLVKDPRWALEVLRTLRQRDERYRLLLIGSAITDGRSAASRDYARAVEHEIAEFGPAVELYGQTDDVASALERVGVILSSSVRESFHAGLIEGAASGALPVVRDWPFFAGKTHSARTRFPDGWVVDTPAEAAERILNLTGSADTWREAGRAASAEAIGRWDWGTVQHDYVRLILGSRATA